MAGITRRSVGLIAVALLAALDVGRSINARVGYATPVEVWQPSAALYADLTWPPGADLAADAPLGARVYARRCAVCHGPDGRGNGPAAPSLIPRPRDFTLGFFKYKSTAPGDAPSDSDLERTIAEGLASSAMPYFKDLLSAEEIRAVVGQVKQMSPIFREGSPPSIHIVPRPPVSPASVDRGRALYVPRCAGCHGLDGRTGGYLQDAKNYPVPVRDLSAPWTFRGGRDSEQVWLRLTTGLAGSSMPAYADALTPGERWDVVSYVESLQRVPPWERGGRLAGRGQQADLLRRGEYIVHAEMCGLCHTQINRTGIYRADDFYLAGGMRVTAYPQGVFVTRNLTSDRETGLGAWSEAEIVNAFRNGRTPTRLLNLWGMPWFYLHHLTDEDAAAVARYLKSLPPVRNRIPDPLHYGVVETIAVKLTRPMPVATPKVLTYADGNFGSAVDPVGVARSNRLQEVLIGLQWAILIIAALALVLAARGARGYRRTVRDRARAVGITFGIIVLGVVGWIVNGLPTLAIIPPEKIVDGATAGIPEPDRTRVKTPEELALVNRGRYLYTIASCAFCHNPDGAGGQKISWRPFGTLWTRNITSDARTGIGAWSDAQIARAIRSGLTPDGRVLHWQGMIWDHASNWDEDDVRALVAYLRMLPAVSRIVPPSRPPAPDDCAVYTFSIEASTVPGCG